LKTIIFFLFTLIVIIFLYNGCGDDPVKNDGGNNEVQDTAILYTDEFGNILGGDTTDWCLNNINGFKFGPAYPNPTLGRSLNVKFSLPAADTVKIYFLNSANDSTVFYNRYSMAGNYEIHITDSTNAWLNTVKRIYIQTKLYSSSSYCRFYGDIKFTQ
jgi:hypothetical protein